MNAWDRGLSEFVNLIDPDAKEPSAAIWQPFDGPQTHARDSAADVIGFGGQAGGGKLLALDTPIPTPDGWTTMGEIAVGDLVFDEQGQPCRVLVVSETQYDTTYRLHFSDESILVAGASHRWVTSNDMERRGRGKYTSNVRTTQQIVDTLRTGGQVNHSIPTTQPLCLPVADLPFDPYLLGLWLGDGWSNGTSYTTADSELIDAFAAAGFEVTKYKSKKYDYYVKGLRDALAPLGVLNNKHIPPIYLRSSIDQRRQLLAGLLDTDGSARPKSGLIRFVNTNKVLIDGVCELIHSLGMKCYVSLRAARTYGEYHSDCWTVNFTPTMTDGDLFRLPRKNKQKQLPDNGKGHLRYIVSAEQIDPVPMRCITVDSPTHLYLAGRTMIPTHNSWLHLGLTHTQHRRSVIFRRQYVDLKQLVDDGDKIQAGRCVFSWGSRSWRTPDGRIIELGAVTDENDMWSWRGRGHDYIGIDEAADFSEKVFRFLTGWLRTDDPTQRLRIVLTFNPPSTAEGEWIKEYFGAWLKEDHSHPARPGELRWYARINDEDVEVLEDWRDYQIINGERVEVKPQSRTFFPASVTDNPVYMATDYPSRLNMLEEPFRSQLLYGDFNIQPKDDPWIVIPTKSVRAAMRRGVDTPRPDLALRAIGADAARGGGDAAAIASMWGNWIGPIATYRGAEIDDGFKLAKIIEDHLMGKAICFLDVIGIGTSPYDILRNRRRLVYGVNFGKASKKKDKSGMLGFANLRAEAYWRAREMLAEDSDWDICLPNDRELFVDLTAPRFEASGKVIKIEPKEAVKERIGRSPDKGDAVVMLLWGVYSGITSQMAFA